MQKKNLAILLGFAILALVIFAVIALKIDLIVFDLPYLILTNLQGHIIEGCFFVLVEFAFFCFIFYKKAKIHPAATSILITTGICFTFYGISKGLVDFDVSDISQSLPRLIEGVKTAFLVSVVAVFLAIILKIIAVLSEIFGSEKDDEFVYIDENQTQLLEQILAQLKQLNEAKANENTTSQERK